MERGTFGFLVIGAGRGGTSLLAGLLDSHPRLEVCLERFSVDCLMGKGLSPAPLPEQCIYERTRRFRDSCEQAAGQCPTSFWGNKITTEQLLGLEDHNRLNPISQVSVLDHFFGQAMKGLKFLFILRDGRACVRSKVSRTGQSWENACDRWLYSVQVYEHLAQRPTDAMIVRYEDLLAAPETTLRSTCCFLGVEYDPLMMHGTSNPKMRPEYRYGKILSEKASPPEIDPRYVERIRPGLLRAGYPT